jgi:hypothetical protein
MFDPNLLSVIVKIRMVGSDPAPCWTKTKDPGMGLLFLGIMFKFYSMILSECFHAHKSNESINLI